MVTRKIVNGGLNTDLADVLVGKNEYVGGLNISINNPTHISAGRSGETSTVYGNSIVSHASTTPSGEQTIGAVEDPAGGRVIWFNCEGDHAPVSRIYCYVRSVNTAYIVLDGADVEGGLGFSPSTPVHSCAVIGDNLYWTQDGQPPRRINIMSGMKAYVSDSYTASATAYDISSPIKQSVITVIRNPPMIPVTFVKINDTTYSNNFIKENAFQFSYRFAYVGGEYSVFGPWSELANFNISSDNSNRIDITIPLSQRVEQDVARIEVVAKNMLSGVVSVVKTYSSTTDSASIVLHNAGTTALSFYFYNDFAGEIIDSESAIKPFDRVPIESKTMCIAKNRLMLGNNLHGYDSPEVSSLSANVLTLDPTGGASFNWFKVDLWTDGTHTAYNTRYYLDLTSGTTSPGYYSAAPYTTAGGPFPGSIAFGSLTFVVSGPSAWGPLVKQWYGSVGSSSVTGAPGVPTLSGSRIFKSGTSYKLGVVFYDEPFRRCGVVSNGTKVDIPDRAYTATQFTTTINWSLSTLTNEIPSWAKYYSIVMTKNTKKSFFIQARCANADVRYAFKDSTTGVWDVSATTFTATATALAIDISLLYKQGRGYNLQAGDLCRVMLSTGSSYTLKVQDVFSNYLIVDIVGVASADIIYEIYSPKLTEQTDIYYQVGNVYKIVGGDFAVKSGSISGDCYALERTDSGTYYTENMSPLDKFWQVWNNIGSSPNTIINTKTQRRLTEVAYSNVYSPGSGFNGLSTFDSADFKTLPVEMSAISRLIRASKVQEQGTIVLAIGESDTVSIYLEEYHWFDNNGNVTASLTDRFIGQVNPLKGGYGTRFPESAFQWEGDVTFFDHMKAAWVRYDQSGLTPISETGNMHGYFIGLSADAEHWLNNSSEYFGLAPWRAIGGYDPTNRNFLLSVSQSSYESRGDEFLDSPVNKSTVSVTTSLSGGEYRGVLSYDFKSWRLYRVTTTAGVWDAATNHPLVLPFYPRPGTSSLRIVTPSASTVSVTIEEYPMSVTKPYNGHSAVWVWDNDISKFITRYSFQPEWLCTVDNRLVSFKDGYMYIHSVDSPELTFYGETHDAAVAVAHGDDGPDNKRYTAFEIEGDRPDWVFARTYRPNFQETSMNEFSEWEGKWFCDVLRDRLSPNTTGDADYKGIFGDDIIGDTAKFQVVFLGPSGEKVIKFVDLTWVPSRGPQKY